MSLSEIPTGIEKVRAHLLTSLHLGRVKPGDRVPSVRRMAALTGLNRKTVHRAYQRLGLEGMIQSRRGSGTYLAEDSAIPPGRPAAGRLLAAMHRWRAEADQLGLTPAQFARFFALFTGDGTRRLRLAVVECNREQTGLISRDLASALGVTIRPVLLDELNADAGGALGDVAGIVTTDCHRDQVVALAQPVGVPVFRIALDARFPHELIARAKSGPVVMVVRDQRFDPAFRRLLKQLKVSGEVASRFTIVEPRGARGALHDAGPQAALYVSPLVAAEVVLDGQTSRVELDRYVEETSVERLKAQLLLDLALTGEVESNGRFAHAATAVPTAQRSAGLEM